MGFGKTICKQLEERLQEHLQAKAEMGEGQPSSLPSKEKSEDLELFTACSSEARVGGNLKTHLPSFPLSPVAAKSPSKLKLRLQHIT